MVVRQLFLSLAQILWRKLTKYAALDDALELIELGVRNEELGIMESAAPTD